MILFEKYQAGGNDFIVIDNRRGIVKNPSQFAKQFCQRKLGIGADGLILIEKAKDADFRFRIFNPDGSEPEMCGNGARCAALFVVEHKIAPAKLSFLSEAGEYFAEVKSAAEVKIKMVDPTQINLDMELEVNEAPLTVNYINTGVPHTVAFSADIENIKVEQLGCLIRQHREFAPQGTNVDFVQARGKNSLAIRTYERGVEGETLACGTGTVASAIIAGLKGLVKSPVKVHTKGGEVLKVYFKKQKGHVKDIFLEGKAKMVFSGKIG